MSSAATAARPCRFALLAALPWEVRPFLRQIQARRWRGLDVPAWEFAVGQKRGLAVLSGVGPEAALAAVRRLLGQERPEILISLGFGGALTPELRPGALVLGTSFWEYDPHGALLTPAPAPAPPRPLPELLGRLRQAGLPAFAGSLVTTPVIMPKAKVGEAMANLAHPVLDQETAVLARVVAGEGLAFLGLRAIMDGAGEEIPPFIVQAGGQVGARAALSWLAADPRRITVLFRLWRRSRRAADRLAQALAVWLPLLLGSGQELQDQPA
jgi:adenosylhomocysteine nucleosidase